MLDRKSDIQAFFTQPQQHIIQSDQQRSTQLHFMGHRWTGPTRAYRVSLQYWIQISCYMFDGTLYSCTVSGSRDMLQHLCSFSMMGITSNLSGFSVTLVCSQFFEAWRRTERGAFGAKAVTQFQRLMDVDVLSLIAAYIRGDGRFE